MFRSPLWEHPVQPTDFLLLRQSDGRWTVRRLQGTAVRARAARASVASAPPDVRRARAPVVRRHRERERRMRVEALQAAVAR